MDALFCAKNLLRPAMEGAEWDVQESVLKLPAPFQENLLILPGHSIKEAWLGDGR
jgi:hypothetical protein